jgi:chaperonin cofactor prefoldin
MGRDTLKYVETLEKKVERLEKEVRRLDEQVEDYWRAQFAGYPGFD